MFFKRKAKVNLNSKIANKLNDLDLLYSSFPSELHNDVSVVIDILKKNQVLGAHFNDAKISIQYHQEVLLVPYRFWDEEVTEEKLTTISQTQLTILCCVYTRSSNGFIRQKYVEKLLQLENMPSWVYLYIIKLCGEYVIEILQTIYDHFDHLDHEKLAEFINENKAFVHLEYCHMVSYWDANYRYNGFHKLKGFIGYELFINKFGHTRAFERFYLETLVQKKLKLKNKLEIFKTTVDLNQNYFYLPINGDQISPEQLRLVKSDYGDEFIRILDDTRWKERLLYNTGYGQPKSFERLPALNFDQLIYIALSYNKNVTFLPDSESKQNALGSVAVIMEDHLDEFVGFLNEQLNNEDLFDDDGYRENLKLFCVDDSKSNGIGGYGNFTYEEYLNTKDTWFWISRKVKDKIYR